MNYASLDCSRTYFELNPNQTNSTLDYITFNIQEDSSFSYGQKISLGFWYQSTDYSQGHNIVLISYDGSSYLSTNDGLQIFLYGYGGTYSPVFIHRYDSPSQVETSFSTNTIDPLTWIYVHINIDLIEAKADFYSYVSGYFIDATPFKEINLPKKNMNFGPNPVLLFGYNLFTSGFAANLIFTKVSIFPNYRLTLNEIVAIQEDYLTQSPVYFLNYYIGFNYGDYQTGLNGDVRPQFQSSSLTFVEINDEECYVLNGLDAEFYGIGPISYLTRTGSFTIRLRIYLTWETLYLIEAIDQSLAPFFSLYIELGYIKLLLPAPSEEIMGSVPSEFQIKNNFNEILLSFLGLNYNKNILIIMNINGYIISFISNQPISGSPGNFSISFNWNNPNPEFIISSLMLIERFGVVQSIFRFLFNYKDSDFHCVSNCLLAITRDQCAICNEGYIYSTSLRRCIFKIYCIKYSPNKVSASQCTCPDSTLRTDLDCSKNLCRDNNCYNCQSDQTTCKTCNTGFTLVSGNCIKNCQAPCLTCDSSDKSKCSSCDPGYYLLGQGCITKCPSKYFPNTTSSTCQQCISICKTCSYSNNCTSCVSGLYLQPTGGLCLTGCPIGYYPDSNENTCKPCDYRCYSCDDESNKQCPICNSNKFKFNSRECLDACPDGYSPTSNFLCTLCDQDCSKCSGIGTGKCLACKDNTKYLSSGFCLSCDKSCSSCSGASSSSCTSCPIGYIFKSGVCSPSKCKSNQYQDAYGNCINCPEGCETCSSSDICITCVPNYELRGSLCFTCSSRFGYTSKDGNCVEICGDGLDYSFYGCDDGNLLPGDGCDEFCIVEEGWICSGGTTTKPDVCKSNSTTKVTFFTDYGEKSVKFNLSKPCKAYIEPSKIFILFELPNYNLIADVSFKIVDSSSFLILFPTSYSTENEIQLRLIRPSSLRDSDGKAINMPPQSFYKNFKVESSISAAGYARIGIRAVYAITVSSLIITGGSIVILNILDSLQNILFLMFLSIEYVGAFKFIIEVFAFANLDWLFNVSVRVKKYFPDIDFDEKNQVAPEKFNDQGYSSIFLFNAGGLLLICIFYPIASKIVENLNKKYQENFVLKLIQKLLSKRAVLIFFMNCQPLIIIMSLLQIINPSFHIIFNGISTILAYICLGLAVMFPVAIYLILKSNVIKLEDQNFKDTYGIFYENCDITSIWTRNFGIITTLFKTILSGSVVLFCQTPILQISVVFILNIIFCSIILRLRPYVLAKENISKIIGQILYTLLCFSILIEYTQRGSESKTTNASYSTVVFGYLFVSCDAFKLIYEQITIFYEIQGRKRRIPIKIRNNTHTFAPRKNIKSLSRVKRIVMSHE